MIRIGDSINITNPYADIQVHLHPDPRSTDAIFDNKPYTWFLTPLLKRGEKRKIVEQRRNRFPRKGTKAREEIEKEAELSGGILTARHIWEDRIQQKAMRDYFEAYPEEAQELTDPLELAPGQNTFPDEDDLPDYKNISESPFRGASGGKTAYVSSDVLKWYCEAFLGLNPATGELEGIKEQSWVIWFPTFDEHTHGYLKERYARNPYYERDPKRERKYVGMIRTPRFVPRKYADEEHARLGARHVLQHLGHEKLLAECPRLMLSRYYWIVPVARSQTKYPKYICFDLDKVDQKNQHKSRIEAEEKDGFSLPKARKNSSIVMGFIKKLADLFSPASPLVFSSSSGSLDKFHVYFLLSDEFMAEGWTCREMQWHVLHLLRPLFDEYGIEDFANGIVEFYPNPTKDLIAPLGINSKFMRQHSDGKFRPHKKQTNEGFCEPSTVDSLHYLEAKFRTGEYKKLDLHLMKSAVSDGMAPNAMDKIWFEVKKEEPKQEEKPVDRKTHPYKMTAYTESWLDVPMKNGLHTETFLKRVVFHKIARNHLGNDLWPVPEDMYPDIEAWINKHLNNENSSRGASGWLDDDGRDYKYALMDFMDDWNPCKIHNGWPDRTEELVRSLFKSIDGHKFKSSPNRGGLINWRAFIFAIKFTRAFSPLWRHDGRFPLTVTECPIDGLVFTRQIANKIIKNLGIPGISKDTIKKYRMDFSKIPLFRGVSAKVDGEKQATEWDYFCPVDLRKSFIDYRTDVRVLSLRIIGKDLLNRMLNKRNLARIQKEMIEEGVIETAILKP